jgi:hypothetical protein
MDTEASRMSKCFVGRMCRMKAHASLLVVATKKELQFMNKQK